MFHVPERARNTTHPVLGTTNDDGNNGSFDLDSPEPGWHLALICSDGNDPDVPEADGWEHVSVHAYRWKHKFPQLRIPTWKEMCFVKNLCWDDDDVVIQYHPAKAEYVNVHPYVLHLWRSRLLPFPTPPKHLVG